MLCFATLIFLLVFYLFIYDDFSYENYVCSKFKSINQDLNDNQSFKDEDDNDKEKFGLVLKFLKIKKLDAQQNGFRAKCELLKE